MIKHIPFRGNTLPIDTSVVEEYRDAPPESMGRQIFVDACYYGKAVEEGVIRGADLLSLLLQTHRHGGEVAWMHMEAEAEEQAQSVNWWNIGGAYLAGALTVMLLLAVGAAL